MHPCRHARARLLLAPVEYQYSELGNLLLKYYRVCSRRDFLREVLLELQMQLQLRADRYLVCLVLRRLPDHVALSLGRPPHYRQLYQQQHPSHQKGPGLTAVVDFLATLQLT